MGTSDRRSDSTRLFAGACDFLRACAAPDQFPPSRILEVAFWGRSNVGKSSLINGLTGRKALARTSKTPGRTQEIIFFDLGQRLMLVDLPGYGHAKAPRAEIDRWEGLIRAYLRHRPPLRLVCLLIDGRHGPLAKDHETMERLDRAGVSYQVILTKIDEVPEGERAARLDATESALATHPAARSQVMVCSADKRLGLDAIRDLLMTLAAPLQ